MDDFENKLNELNQDLFRAIPSQNTTGDRESLLALQRLIRQSGSYVYLEIGSHLGGTIQPHYADPRCRVIYSVDKRPMQQPDERGEVYAYPDNSTQAMRDNLKRAFPAVDEAKLVTFDSDARDVDPAQIDEVPGLCLIDGEHTNEAAMADFLFCLSVTGRNAMIAMHDSGVILEAILAIKEDLREQNIPFTGLKLGGSVYLFILGDQRMGWKAMLAPFLRDEDTYFRGAIFHLNRQRRAARLRHYPVVWPVYNVLLRCKDWLYLSVYCRIAGRQAYAADGNHEDRRRD